MVHYILAGEEAVSYFQNENWADFQNCIEIEKTGEIYSFDYSSNNPINELLEQLRGWNSFIELSGQDIKDIEDNTKIEIQKQESIKLPIYWSTDDFEDQAKKNFEELKRDNPKEFEHLENWGQLYDKSKFPNALKEMIRKHDCENGITWLNVEEYLYECEIKTKTDEKSKQIL